MVKEKILYSKKETRQKIIGNELINKWLDKYF